MPDYPNPTVGPMFLHNFSRYSFMWELQSRNTPSSQSWNTANVARYYPVSIPFPYPVNRVYWVNGTSVGVAVDFGIYTFGGTRLYSTGSVTSSGASIPQYTTPGTPFMLPPGDYYFALNVNGTTSRVMGANVGANVQRMTGIKQEALGSVTLPATATFAAVGLSNGVVGLCGVTWTTTGF